MKLKFFISFFITSLCVQTHHSQYTDIINTNRPGESFGAFSVGKTIIQAEGGLSYISEKYKPTDADIKGFMVDLDLRYGFWREQLEFIADIQYRNDKYAVPDFPSSKRSFLETTALGFKYLVYDPFKNHEEKVNIYSWNANQKFKWRQFLPAVAVYAAANINASNNPYIPEDMSVITPKAMILLQNHFNGGWVFVTNGLADHIGTDYMTLGGIFTATKSLNDRWSGFVEAQGYKSDFHKDVVLRAGGVYLLNEDTQIDVSIGKNFNNSQNIVYGGLGFSWRFSLNYEDTIMYRTIESESAEPKSKEEEEEEETSQQEGDESNEEEDSGSVENQENQTTQDGNTDNIPQEEEEE